MKLLNTRDLEDNQGLREVKSVTESLGEVVISKGENTIS